MYLEKRYLIDCEKGKSLAQYTGLLWYGFGDGCALR